MALNLAFLANPKFWAGAGKVAGVTKTGFDIKGFFTGKGATKKAKSIAGTISDNQQHAVNYFNNELTNPNSQYFRQGYLDDSDYNAMVEITNWAIDSIGSNHKFGIGQSYTSKFTGQTYNTAPSSAIAPKVDEYIEAKLNQKLNNGQMAEQEFLSLIGKQEGLMQQQSQDIQGLKTISERQSSAIQNLTDFIKDIPQSVLSTYQDIQSLKLKETAPAPRVIPERKETNLQFIIPLLAIGLIAFFILRRR